MPFHLPKPALSVFTQFHLPYHCEDGTLYARNYFFAADVHIIPLANEKFFYIWDKNHICKKLIPFGIQCNHTRACTPVCSAASSFRQVLKCTWNAELALTLSSMSKLTDTRAFVNKIIESYPPLTTASCFSLNASNDENWQGHVFYLASSIAYTICNLWFRENSSYQLKHLG